MKKLRLSITIVFAIFCFFLFMPNRANANEIIKIAYCPLENFYETDSYGTPYGYGIDYLTELAAYTGWTYEYVYCESWEDAIRLIKDGQADILAPTAYTKDRNNWGLFSDTSIMSTYNAIMCLNTKEDYIYEDFENINQMTIGCSKGFNAKEEFFRYLSSRKLTPKIKYYPTEANARSALDKGEIDAYVSNVMDMDKNLKILAKFSPLKLYYFTNKKNASLMEQLNDALNDIQINSPFFQQSLYNNYFSTISAAPLTKGEREYMKKIPAITVACASDYFPLSYINTETNELDGVIPDILHMIEENSGLKFKLIPVSSSTVPNIQTALKKKADAVCPIELSNYFIHSNQYILSKPFLTFKKLLISRNSLHYNPTKSYRMGIVSTYKDGLNRVISDYPKNHLIQYDSVQSLLNALKAGKVDIILINEYAAQSYLIGPRYSSLNVIPASGTSYQLTFSLLAFDNQESIDAKLLSDPKLISIINKSISLLPKDRINEDIISHATHRAYDTTIQDLISNYRQFIVVCIALILFVIIIIIYTISAQHHNSVLLKKALQEAEEGSRIKSEFLSRISHDIRTPMNAIVGMANLAQMNITSSFEVQKYLNQIKASSDYLLSLLNDILDMSSIESRKLILNKTTFHIGTLLEHILIMIENQVLSSKLTLEKHVADLKYSTLIGDPARLHQILFNLLSNAVKYTPAQGKIYLYLDQKQIDDSHIILLFTIKDTGIGMSEEFMKKMYEPFEQETADMARTQASNGLGLSIVYSLVELMNGSIHAESELKKGTAFYLELPFEISLEPLKENLDLTADNNICFHRESVLLVDDNELNLEIAKSLLELYNLKVETASNGQEAVDKFKASKENFYSIVFMDIRMPVLDGLEACNIIRNLARSDAAAVPIIAMTANTSKEDKTAAFQAGMNQFLPKPLDTKLLLHTLKQYIS